MSYAPIRWALLAALSIVTPAFAQDSAPAGVSGADASSADTNVDTSRDRLTVGVGVGTTPRYSGASRSMTIPVVAVQGQVSGISFATQGTSVFADLIPSKGKPGWKLQFGPEVALRLDRNTSPGDVAVARLGKIDRAWEAGGWVGVQRTGVVTSAYDTLSFSASWQKDLSGVHNSAIFTPSIDYDTPLSRRAYVSLSLSADHVGRGFGDTYFDITPAGSAASGLPVYAGADHPGWKDWNASGLLAQSLTGDLTHGLGLFATAGYSRLLGDYGRSPVVRERGQTSAAIGVEFTF